MFGGWDHKLTTKQGVRARQRDLGNSFKLLLAAKQEQLRNRSMTGRERFKLTLVRVGINLLAVALLLGTGAVIYLLVSEWVPNLLESGDCNADTSPTDILTELSGFTCLLAEYLPSIAITFVNMTLPLLFTRLIVYERYAKNAELIINLTRCILLRLAALAIAFYSVYFTVRCEYVKGCYDGDTVDNLHLGSHNSNAEDNEFECQENEIIVQACSNDPFAETLSSEGSYCRKPICWETYVGQELYKLTVTDLLVQTGLIFVVDVFRVKVVGRWLPDLLSNIQFNVSKHVLDIVYSQTICWLAVFFAPLILAVTVGKTLLLFLFRMFYVRAVSKMYMIQLST